MLTDQSQSQVEGEIHGFDNLEEREYYGYPSLDVLASSNPSSWIHPGANISYDRFWPVVKQIFPLNDNTEFIAAYEESLYPAIDSMLKTMNLIPVMKELHTIRMGFQDNCGYRNPHPITILFIVKRDCISVEDAKQIVKAVMEKLATTWNGEPYVVHPAQISAHSPSYPQDDNCVSQGNH